MSALEKAAYSKAVRVENEVTTLNTIKKDFMSSNELQIVAGSPSLTKSQSGSTCIMYWSMSGSTDGQSLAGFFKELDADADGVEVSLYRIGINPTDNTKTDVYQCYVSSIIDGSDVDDGLFLCDTIPLPSLASFIFSEQIIASFVPVDTTKPVNVRVRRNPLDALDTNTVACGIIGVAIKSVVLGRGTEVQTDDAYNSWPLLVSSGNNLVCIYSKGVAHATDNTRSIWRRISSDEGANWGAESKIVDVVDTEDGATGKGVDSNGNILIWVRHGQVNETAVMELYRSTDGGNTFASLSTPTFADTPVLHIGDIFEVPTVGLMSFYHAGNYISENTRSWGVVYSADNGATWTQRQVESGLTAALWPTESSGAYIGSGKILGMGRIEITSDARDTTQAHWQLQSSDYGETWTKVLTNITDVNLSTNSVIYDSDTDAFTTYYWHRGFGNLKKRETTATAIWDNPKSWSMSTPLCLGSLNISDSGNANATKINGRHIVSFYSGDETNTGIYVYAP